MRIVLSAIALALLLAPAPAAPRFTDISAASGAQGFWISCGIGASDFDNDGFIDFCTSAVNGGSTRVYRNNGNGTFSDIANSGIGGECQAVAFGDIDNDGLPDVFCGWYWTISRLFKGTGGLNPPFSDITGPSGTTISQSWEGGAFADVNNDGNLDLFVSRTGGNRLFMGNGTASALVNESGQRGVELGGTCRAYAFGDVDGDGDDDLIIGQDNTFLLFINNGSGFFADGTTAAGLSGLVVPGASAQVAQFADIDNDGDLDLYLAGWNKAWLFRNNGNGTFTDISVSSGVTPLAGGASCAAAFGATFGDYDNDGFLDLFIGGGEMGGGSFQNLLFHNNGNNTFTEVGVSEGVADSARPHVGAVFFDLENDGDLDLFVGGNPVNLILRNETNNADWLKVRVQGTLSNRSGIGAKVWVYDAGHLDDPAFLRGFREVTGGSGQGSCPPTEQHFGLPSAGAYDVKVRFLSGSTAVLTGKAATQILSVVEPILPVVISVSSTAANGTYGNGTTIPVFVNFSHPVTVTGTPTLTLETGAADAVVSYASGSGTSSLRFDYAVAPGHVSPDLDCVSSSALALNGGTIRSATLTDADVTLPVPAATGSLGAIKNLVIDGDRPGVVSVTSVEPDGSYIPGQVIHVVVTFGESVTVTGTPQLTLETGAADAVVSYSSGSGTPSLQFDYTAGPNDVSGDLDYLSSAALALNGGTIRNGSLADAALTLPSPGSPGSLGANRNIVLLGPQPTVDSVTSTAADGTYGVGSPIPVRVVFSIPVVVTGVPQLTLETGASDAVVSYASGSGTTTLTFSYTVASGHATADLDCVSTSALALNGGSIRSSAGRDADLTLPAPGGAGSLGAAKNIVVDGNLPGVVGVSSVEASGLYLPGSVLHVTVSFSENVVVTGTPRLTLETGATDAVADYFSGSGSTTLQFVFTVAANHLSADLDCVSGASLALNGGTIKDGGGNNAVLTLPTPGAAGSLGANRNLLLPGPAPTVTSVTSPDPDGPVNPGNLVSVSVVFSAPVAVTGTPTLTLETGASDAVASYITGSGTNVLTFQFVVRPKHVAADLDYGTINALSVAGGSIESLTGAPAVLTLPTPGGAGSLGANKNISLAPGTTLIVAGGCGLLGPEALLLLALLPLLRRRR